jgi:hypothetical protein
MIDMITKTYSSRKTTNSGKRFLLLVFSKTRAEFTGVLNKAKVIFALFAIFEADFDDTTTQSNRCLCFALVEGFENSKF